MRIQHNIMAMSAYRNYTNNVSAMKKNLEKLSSGYKINRAGDDAAGLAISEKMRAQITGLETAQKNAKDGISLVQTAEGALTEVHDMLNRMVELATQSANGTYDDTTDRAQMQKELDQLRAEIDRIADSSNFNGINLLNGEMDAGGGTVNGNIVLPGEGNTLGADTLLRTPATEAAKSSFTLELDTLTWDAKAGDELEISLGADKITLTAAADKKYTASELATAIKTQFEDAAGNNGKLGSVDADVEVTGTNVKFTAKVEGVADGFAVNRDITMKVTFAAGGTQSRSISREGEGGGEGTPSAVNGTAATAAQVKAATGGQAAVYSFALTGKAESDLTGKAIDGVNVPSWDSDLDTTMGAFVTAYNGTDGKDYTASWDSSNSKLVLTAKAVGTVASAPTTTIENSGSAITASEDTAGQAPTTPAVTMNASSLTDSAIKTAADGTDGIASGSITISKNDSNNLELKIGDKVIGTSTETLDGSNTTFNFTAADGSTSLGSVTFSAALANSDTVSGIETGLSYVAAGSGSGDGDGDGDSEVTTVTKTVDMSSALDTVDFSDPDNTLSNGEVFALQTTYATNGTGTAIQVNSDITVNLAGFADSFTGGTTTVGDVADAIKAKVQAAVDAWNASDASTTAGYTYTNIRVEDSEGNQLSRAANQGEFVIRMDQTPRNTPTPGTGSAKGLSGNFNAASSKNVKGADADAGQYASTTFNLSQLNADGKFGDGSTITIAGETYKFVEGDSFKADAASKTITLTKGQTGSTRLEEAARGLSQMTNANFTIGSEDPASGKIVLDEKAGGATADVQKKLTTVKDFESLISFKAVTAQDSTKGLKLQIGDTADEFNQLRVSIGDAHCKALGIDSTKISIADQDSAAKAVDAIKAAINQVSDIRGTLGATQNRLDHTINNLSVMTENIQDAESTIRDVDVAEEMMAYTKNNILIQSAQAMLAQANQVPQGVLQLLQ